MRIEKKTNTEERKILIAMVVNRVVLSKVASKWTEGMFQSKWANIVADLCVSYFNQYSEPPASAIEGMFEAWAEETQDTATVELVEKFLAGLSNEYKKLAHEINPQFVIDLAGKYFNKVRLRRLSEAVTGDLDRGKHLQAKQRVVDFTHIEMGGDEGVDPFSSADVVREAFEQAREPVIKYPGALGQFFGDELERDGFIAFMGPEKRGKTWWLLDVAWRAITQRRKVAFFSVGDMSKNQVIRRLMIRASACPSKPARVRKPVSIEVEDGEPRLRYKFKRFEKGLTWRRAWKAVTKLKKLKLRSKKPLLRVSTHPNDSINVQGIEAILRTWEREEWVPDVIVIDYADILLMDQGGSEHRDKVNKTWKQLRAMSQKRHCLVVTATQSDAASYTVDTMGQGNFSDDKRKLAHVTGIVGLNQSLKEKELGVMRLNWIVVRERESSSLRCVYVASCLDIGNPAVKSTF